ncbi:MAG: DUF1778 domain-containing protein [Burkholderiales bacterium]
MPQAASPAILSVRVSAAERTLLESAAAQSRTTLSDFIRRKAIDAAEADVLDRRSVVIAAKDWEKFEAWAHAPARKIPALRKLSRTPPVWKV